MLTIGHALQAAKLMHDVKFFNSLRPWMENMSLETVARVCIADPDGCNEHFGWDTSSRLLKERHIPIKSAHFSTYWLMRCHGTYEEAQASVEEDEEELLPEDEVPSTMEFFDHLWKFMITLPKNVPIKDWM